MVATRRSARLSERKAAEAENIQSGNNEDATMTDIDWEPQSDELRLSTHQGRFLSPSDPEGANSGSVKLVPDEYEFLSPQQGRFHLLLSCLRVKGAIGSDSIALAQGGEEYSSLFLPLSQIEQVFIVRNPKRSAPKREAYKVVIIQTGCIGASVVLRGLYEPFIFQLPNRQVTGAVAKYTKDTNATELSLIEEVFNKNLKKYRKKVQRLFDPAGQPGTDETFEAGWNATDSGMGEDVQARRKHVKGHIHLAPTGFLYLTKDHRAMYLPFRIVKRVMLIVNKDIAIYTHRPPPSGSTASDRRREKAVDIRLLIEITEPGATEQQDSPYSKMTLVNFTQISMIQFARLKTYLATHAEQNHLGYDLLQSTYMDYDAGELLTGFMPLED